MEEELTGPNIEKIDSEKEIFIEEESPFSYAL